MQMEDRSSAVPKAPIGHPVNGSTATVLIPHFSSIRRENWIDLSGLFAIE